MMIHGKTKSGFEFAINPAACTDIRYLRSMSDIMKYNSSEVEEKDMSRLMDAVDSLLKLLLPKDTERLYQHISSQNEGFVPAEALMLELNEMILAATPKK